MTAHVVYSSGTWGETSMGGQQCDRHPSARAKARIMFPNLTELYLCGHCCHAFEGSYHGEFYIAYEGVTV